MGPAVFEGQGVGEYIQVVAVTGELDLSNASNLARQVETAVRSGRNCVVIDLSDGSMVVVAPESIVVLKDFHNAASLRAMLNPPISEMCTRMKSISRSRISGTYSA